MPRVVYTPEPAEGLPELFSPRRCVADLWHHRGMIFTLARRDFQATYKGTHLGAAWAFVTPLLMLLMFTFVFGEVFNGRFTGKADETSVEFALALFIGLSCYTVIGSVLGSAPTVMAGNAAYVKSLTFPVQILPVIIVVNAMWVWVVSVLLCCGLFALTQGYLNMAVLALPVLGLCLALMGLGFAWTLGALCPFVRDIQGFITPLTVILMFMSCVFFPLTAVPGSVRWLVGINPLARIIQEGRDALMFGTWPNPVLTGLILAASAGFAMIGYAVFMRMKAAFADVL